MALPGGDECIPVIHDAMPGLGQALKQFEVPIAHSPSR